MGRFSAFGSKSKHRSLKQLNSLTDGRKQRHENKKNHNPSPDPSKFAAELAKELTMSKHFRNLYKNERRRSEGWKKKCMAVRLQLKAEIKESQKKELQRTRELRSEIQRVRLESQQALAHALQFHTTDSQTLQLAQQTSLQSRILVVERMSLTMRWKRTNFDDLIILM